MNNLIKLLDKNLEYIEHEIIEDTIYISVKSIKEYICCPYCCTPSNKVHSKYKTECKHFQLTSERTTS